MKISYGGLLLAGVFTWMGVIVLAICGLRGIALLLAVVWLAVLAIVFIFIAEGGGR